MRNERFRRYGLALAGGALACGAVLAALDSGGFQTRGWLAYSLLLGVGAVLLAAARRLVAADSRATWAAAAAFGARLIIGVALTALLPQLGYPDNPVHQSGYVFYDSFLRDRDAWELANTGRPLLSAFQGAYTGDQYGGTLALFAGVYRGLSLDLHRPNLILILTATAGALGVLFVWKASQAWFGERAALPAAWIMALYPEAMFLGSSQMREAFLIPAIAMAWFGLTDSQARPGRRSPWLFLAILILFALSPPVAVAALGILLVAWALDPDHPLSKKGLAILAALLALGAVAVIAIFAQYPSLERAAPWRVLLEWLEFNTGFQSYLLERASGWVQKLVREAGDRWQLLIVVVYGFARPVLPAELVVPGNGLVRVMGILRATGWYLLAPLLIYGLPAAWRSDDPRRRQILWLLGMTFVWALLAALIGGGDQWDNPRYRTILIAVQAPLAAWAWTWARTRKDPWLGRWLAVEGLFVLLFTEWYISRYTQLVARLNFWVMVGVIVVAAFLILAGGWWRDRRRRERRMRDADPPLAGETLPPIES